MNICVFDTETTSLDKPFCYDIGYTIINIEKQGSFYACATLCSRSFVVEQVWHNLPLFQSAYYAAKRPLYVSAMRARTSILNKFGYICQQMRRDFKQYEVEGAYAYNSDFDEKVFNFNCDWYKCVNPFDNIPIFDIRGYAHRFLIGDEYKEFCDRNGYYTDTGNYSTTAETVFRFISGNTDFDEAHTALNDSEIESEILFECVTHGAILNHEYKAFRSIEKEQEKTLHIRTVEQTDYYFDYKKIRINKDKTEITLR